MRSTLAYLPLAVLMLMTLVACGGGGGSIDPAPLDDPAPGGQDPSAPTEQVSDIELATKTIKMSSASSQSPDRPSIEGLVFQIGESFYSPTAFSPLLTSDDDGREIELAAGDSAGLDALFERLVDGSDDNIGFGFMSYPRESGGGGGSDGDESLVLKERHPRLIGYPDLHGADVTRIVIRLDEIHVSSFGTQNYYTIDATVSIRGNLRPTAGAIPFPEFPSLPGTLGP